MAMFGRDASKSVPAHAPAPPNGPTQRSISLIAKGTKVVGTVSGAGELHVDGAVEGAVRFDGAVFVAAGAEVAGPIEAKIVRVAGKVVGAVEARERVEMFPTGHLAGDVTSPRVAVSEGAVLEGKVTMTLSASAASSAGSASSAGGARKAG
jgi:cytoskeletal protein CcmA (bactofilin family)